MGNVQIMLDLVSIIKIFLSSLHVIPSEKIEVIKIAKAGEGWEVEALLPEGGSKRKYFISVNDTFEVQCYMKGGLEV